MAEIAACSCMPVTFGTIFLASPADTTRLTDEWAFTLVPSAGLVEITLPDGTVADARLVTGPTTRLAFTMSARAWARGRPVTAGTEMLPATSSKTMAPTSTQGQACRRGGSP